MACYNSSLYIDEAISSVLAQTLGDLELILIDDCSTDNTLEIANRYKEQDGRVSVLSLPVNSGAAIARNAGILVAQGEWLGILDSDDVAMPLRFEEQMKLANSDKDLIMIGSNAISIDEKGQLIKKHKYPTTHQALVKRMSSNHAFPPHSSMLYKRDIVDKLSGFNPRYVLSEDADLCLRLAEQGEIACLEKPMVKIRKHANNISLHDGGRLSTMHATAALVCHFLRIKGAADPSASKEDADWLAFTEWIAKRLEQEEVFESQQEWTRMRQAYYSAGNKLFGVWRLLLCLAMSKYTFRILREKYCDSNLALKLAAEWTKKNSGGANIM